MVVPFFGGNVKVLIYNDVGKVRFLGAAMSGCDEAREFDLMTLSPGETVWVTMTTAVWVVTATARMVTIEDTGRWVKGVSVMVRTASRRNPVLDLVDPESFLLQRVMRQGEEHFYRPDRGSTGVVSMGRVRSLVVARPQE